MIRPAILALLALIGPAAAADPIVGRASVIDGDTIEIAGTRIRLHGIDAPESGQTCQDEADADYPCGRRAAFALSDKIGAAPVSCEPRDRDRYGRIVAVCTGDGEDLNAWMVIEGHALAFRRYSMAYVEHEAAARTAQAGMWAGKFTPPWDWRREKRAR